MRILVLSFYYPPDLGPGPFRASALVEALREILPADTHIDVVTTMPNRYSGFNAAAPALEELPGLTLHRINLPAHQSGMLDQSKAFLTYARNAVKIARQNKYDLVLATSSRLMTAALGAWISRRTGACLYLDIRDIFVDTIKDVLPKRFARVAKPLFSVLEGWTMRRASKINLVSAGFGEYFSTRYPRQPYSFFTNGIDDEFLPEALPLAAPAQEKSGKILSVLYAGNIGEGQGLHTILPPLAARMLRLGDETGQLPLLAGRVAEFYEAKLQRSLGPVCMSECAYCGLEKFNSHSLRRVGKLRRIKCVRRRSFIKIRYPE